MPSRSRSFSLWVVAATTVLGCSSAATDDASSEDATGALAQESSDEPVARDRLPEPAAFQRWQEDTTSISPPRPKDVARIAVACADKKLYPTHPQSSLKRYHRYAHGQYDHFKISGDSPVCKIPSNSRNAKGERPCAAAAGIDYAMLSDTYLDSCGNSYRGFWEVLYLTTEESMGTLMSKGRTVYAVPNAQFSGEVYDAQTYAVDASEFLFFSALLPQDAELIARARDDAKTTHRYDDATHVFEYTGPNR